LISRCLLLIELNEVNFDFIRFYASRGELPEFASLLGRHGLSQTMSEACYEHLEPWIQWVTAHTGLSYSEHGVLRLGDITHTDLEQIWEVLERAGLQVGAISPMNAKHRLNAPAFFVPDPWTRTKMSARKSLERLYAAIAQAVNDNAQSRITLRSLIGLLAGFVAYAQPRHYCDYARLVAGAGRPWRKAIFLDLLLADVFVKEVKSSKLNFASLFLNAAAHIQHHYMFCAAPYAGPHRNPRWYVSPGTDPIIEIYKVYDQIIGNIRRQFPEARMMVATGLHQEPHEDLTFYWRLRDHDAFLRSIGVPFASVEPRMSRDFLIHCTNPSEAVRAQHRLEAVIAACDGLRLFEVDNRGTDLFVMLTYPREVPIGFDFTIGDQVFHDLADAIAFVAIKNGEHNGIGYFLDTGEHGASKTFELRQLPNLILQALEIDAKLGTSTAARV